MHQVHVSAASELLRKALEERSKKAELARELNVRPDLVGRWTTGERKPTPATRAVLQDKLGIDWRLWDQDPPAGEEPPAPPSHDPHDGRAA